MRRVLLIGLALASAAVVGVVGCGSDDGGDGYLVRGIFDNAVSAIPGEDVKIAGVKVGSIDELDVSSDGKAIIVMRITEPGFQDFRKDAKCIIRPQGFIGEKFVDCSPTSPRRPGQPEAPELTKIERGRGEGQYLLPVTNTTTPVDLDLINNTFRLPYAQRLTLILNELGAGVAGRGKDLDEVIRRANPALKELDEVLAILAKQNRVLADLARNSDESLAPLARDRQRVADFIVKANEASQATAERSSALEATFARLPTFLRELRPTFERLSELSASATPTLRDLGAVAPSINRLIAQLGPFADASRPAFRSLGRVAQEGSRALPAAEPVIEDLRQFADPARPVSADLSKLVTDLRDTGAVERIMDFLFFTTAATNGFDSIGRYLRVQLVANACALYANVPSASCNANFYGPSGTAPPTEERILTRAASNGTDPQEVAAQLILGGMDPKEALEKAGAKSVDDLYGKAGSDKETAKDEAKDEEEAKEASGRRDRAKSRRPAAKPEEKPIELPELPVLGSPRPEGAPAAAPQGGAPATAAPKSDAPAAKPRAGAPAKAGSRRRKAAEESTPASVDPAARAALEREQAQTTLFDYLLGNAP